MNAFLGVSFRSDPGQRGSRRNHPANPSPKQTPTHELNDLAKLYLTPRTHTPLCRSSPQRVPGLLFRKCQSLSLPCERPFRPQTYTKRKREAAAAPQSATAHQPIKTPQRQPFRLMARTSGAGRGRVHSELRRVSCCVASVLSVPFGPPSALCHLHVAFTRGMAVALTTSPFCRPRPPAPPWTPGTKKCRGREKQQQQQRPPQ